MSFSSLIPVLEKEVGAVSCGERDGFVQEKRFLLEVPAERLLEAVSLLPDSRLLFATASYVQERLFWLVNLIVPTSDEQLCLRVPAGESILPSLTDFWEYADWQEREAHELFGIRFHRGPDLEPFLLRAGSKPFPHRRN